jgi:hypothetical protein
MFSAAQAGGIYKWVDKNGNVHYSQDPQGSASQEIHLKIPKASGDNDSGDNSDAPAAAAKKADKDKPQEKAKQEAAAISQKEAKEKNCQISMKRLAAISAGGRLYEVDESGERNYWDDDTRKAKLAEAQKSVDQWCTQE